MRVVVDTDVLVAALRSDQGASRQLLLASLDRRLVMLVSVPLMLEYEAVLTRQEHLAAAGITADDVYTVLDALAAVMEPVRLAFLWRPRLKDAADEMVLETAVNGGADRLVTFNLKHLGKAAAEFGATVANLMAMSEQAINIDPVRRRFEGLLRRIGSALDELKEVEDFFQPAVLNAICALANEYDNPKKRKYVAGMLSVTCRRRKDEVTVRIPKNFRLPERGAPALHDLSLALVRGEVFGIAGVDGNGQRELGEVIAGQRHVSSGHVLLGNRDITNIGVNAATRLGIGYVTDDRLHEGSVASATIAENVALKAVGRRPFSNGFWLDRAAMAAEARRMIADYSVKAPGPDAAIGTLSGGNIQKLLLARELALDPELLVCNKPTTGLDLKTTRFVLNALRQQASAGKVVVLISSELDELLDVSDRIGVMYNGQLVAVMPRAEADQEILGNLMLGGERSSQRIPA